MANKFFKKCNKSYLKMNKNHPYGLNIFRKDILNQCKKIHPFVSKNYVLGVTDTLLSSDCFESEASFSNYLIYLEISLELMRKEWFEKELFRLQKIFEDSSFVNEVYKMEFIESEVEKAESKGFVIVSMQHGLDIFNVLSKCNTYEV